MIKVLTGVPVAVLWTTMVASVLGFARMLFRSMLRLGKLGEGVDIAVERQQLTVVLLRIHAEGTVTVMLTGVTLAVFRTMMVASVLRSARRRSDGRDLPEPGTCRTNFRAMCRGT